MSRNSIRRLQVLGVSIAGVIAGIAFVLSLVLGPDVAGGFRTVATIFAFICALIGVSFAFTGRRS